MTKRSDTSGRRCVKGRGGGRRRSSRLVVLAAGVLVVAAAACSSDDDGADPTDLAGTTPTTTTTTGRGDATTTTAADATTTTGPGTTGPDTTVAGNTATTVEPTEVTVPDTGVPGLDSDVVMCRAWSRFAGSYQVVAVAAAFGDDTAEVARLEIAASPVVTSAYDEMVGNWPAELAAEADVAAEVYLGAYARRSARALAALTAAGADADTLDAIATAWLDALAARDPSEVLPTLVLPPSVVDVVDAAASDFDERIPPIPADPSLVTDADVPLTEAFLLDTCPDRGTLGGGEVGG